MQRREWFELHDHRLYPRFLRDLMTDALGAIWNRIHCYRVIVPHLRAAMKDAGTSRIVDLCSGGGGPWLRLQQEFLSGEGLPIHISLTDKYPNHEAFKRASAVAGVHFYLDSVDATQVPAQLSGFRTIFTSFHHFGPKDARAMLADAVARHQGIAVFETPRRDVRTILATCAVPLLSWYVTPGIRPFRWSRLVWTYLLPVVPFTLVVDGLLSCLRAYSLNDLRELTHGLGGEDYRWEMGEERSWGVGITYLIGRPWKGNRAEEEPAVSAYSQL
jgi:hypothetical protein